MRPIRSAMFGLVAELMLLWVLDVISGLSGMGWSAGIAFAVITNVALVRGLTRADRYLGPADRVTLARATMVGGVAALTAESFAGTGSVASLVALAIVALALDCVDGRVARRTATSSAFGARFDMEIDAALILILSGYVAQSAGAWVLAIGLARYAFVVAGQPLRWLRASAPARGWCKVVAASQGVVLTVAATQVLPLALTELALGGAAALLAESFGREVSWLWRHRRPTFPPLRLHIGTQRDPEQLQAA